MKKFICILLLIILTLSLTSCFSDITTSSNNTKTSLDEIQDIVRETQSAFNSKDSKATQEGISKLIKLSQNSLYSENERAIAQYCATYINSGVMLDYIIKNDNAWLQSHDVSKFDILHRGLFDEVINGHVTHTETLKGYNTDLVQSTVEIYNHYNELIGK